MENNHYKFEIQKIHLKDNVSLSPKKINVFIGANNCGKTQLLKDILAYITRDLNSCVVIESLDIPKPSSWSDISSKYGMRIFPSINGEELRHISPTFDPNDVPSLSTFQLEDTMDNWLRSDNESAFWKHTGAGLVTFLNTDNRLKLIMSQQANNVRLYGARNVLEAVYLADTDTHCEISENIRESIKTILGMDVYLDVTNPGMLQYRVGKDFHNIPLKAQEAYKELSKYPLADNQGDGLRSVLGIISAILAVKRPIILLDEPEAFLHPPQVIQLGRSLIDFFDDSEKQVFISTHSADFLRGLFSVDINQFENTIEIVHIRRVGNQTMFNVLDKDILDKIVKDPLLSSSRVLEGMFYKGVVATEGDSDAIFYQRIFQKRYPAEEIHFANAHNKQTLKKIVEPYKKLGIKFAMIADADIIRDVQEFKATLKIADLPHETIERILMSRKRIYEYFASQSYCERLNTLTNKLREIVGSNENVVERNEEQAKSLLDESRKQLKKLRENSDELCELKQKGEQALPTSELRKIFNDLYNDCRQLGLFIVKVGELESWLIDYNVERKSNKSKWIVQALEKLPQITAEPDQSNKNLWKFIDDLHEHFKN